jgi:hypothetical protein
MNELEYELWCLHAEMCLRTVGYISGEIDEILDWFRGIRGSAERGLIGDAAVDAHLTIMDALTEKTGEFNLHCSLMSRLFIYAPLILKEWREKS